MKKWLPVLFLLGGATTKSQTLTVEKIMRDPKWIGSSPSAVFWAYDSKAILFNWNPEQAPADSTYSYMLNSKAPLKINHKDAQVAKAIASGTYNHIRTKIAFIYKGDIHLLDIASGSIT